MRKAEHEQVRYHSRPTGTPYIVCDQGGFFLRRQRPNKGRLFRFNKAEVGVGEM